MHILSPETDNCPSWISRRERITVENISWSISTKECCRPRRGLNPRPPDLQSDGASNWATEAGIQIMIKLYYCTLIWLHLLWGHSLFAELKFLALIVSEKLTGCQNKACDAWKQLINCGLSMKTDFSQFSY